MRNDVRGVTLLELLLAVALAVATVAAISILFPKSAANITNNRHRWVASNFAAADIQRLKAQPYAQIPLTNPASFLTTGTTTCDCTIDLAGMTPDSTFTEDGVTYTRQSCINLVNQTAGNWASYCPNNPLTSYPSSPTGPDFGLKSVHVRVSWTYGGATQVYDTESLVTR